MRHTVAPRRREAAGTYIIVVAGRARGASGAPSLKLLVPNTRNLTLRTTSQRS